MGKPEWPVEKLALYLRQNAARPSINPISDWGKQPDKRSPSSEAGRLLGYQNRDGVRGKRDSSKHELLSICQLNVEAESCKSKKCVNFGEHQCADPEQYTVAEPLWFNILFKAVIQISKKEKRGEKLTVVQVLDIYSEVSLVPADESLHPGNYAKKCKCGFFACLVLEGMDYKLV